MFLIDDTGKSDPGAEFLKNYSVIWKMCNYHIGVRSTLDQWKEFAGLKIEFCGYVWSWIFPWAGERSRKSAASPNTAPERRWKSLFEEWEFRGDSLDSPSLPRLCIVNASQMVPECPAFVSWFIVPIIQHEKRVHTRPLCVTQVGEKVRLRQRFISFLPVLLDKFAPKHTRLSRETKASRTLKAFCKSQQSPYI